MPLAAAVLPNHKPPNLRTQSATKPADDGERPPMARERPGRPHSTSLDSDVALLRYEPLRTTTS
jgi:hypothetical protein